MQNGHEDQAISSLSNKKKKWNNFAYEGEWGQFCKPREFQISRAFKLLRDKLCVLIRKI